MTGRLGILAVSPESEAELSTKRAADSGCISADSGQVYDAKV